MTRGAAVALVVFAACTRVAARPRNDAGFANRHPVELRRSPERPLSNVAQLGQTIFNDRGMSASGALACRSCHDPAHAYAPAAASPDHLGGIGVPAHVTRAVPSLMYLARTPVFSIGPDDGAENVDVHAVAMNARGTVRAIKRAHVAAPPALVPQGGLFWDGRVSTLEDQAMEPLRNPDEMAYRSVGAVATHLRRRYGSQLAALFGRAVLDDTVRLVDEAMFAVARYEVEDASFRPYASRYDAWLEGKATLTAAEWRGLQAFDDPSRGNCAACHVDRPGADGSPPRFTDDQYEALGVPRNPAVSTTDLGLCGPLRRDLADQTQYCGMFHTPSLRNSATRHTFFHNGVYATLPEVLRFYNLRDVHPALVYRARNARDLPFRFVSNIDTADGPFGRRRHPAMSDQDLADIAAFLGVLTDTAR